MTRNRYTKQKWDQVRWEYIHTPKESLQALGEKHGIPPSSVRARCRRENWNALRPGNAQEQEMPKTREKGPMERTLAVTDRLLGKVEQASRELETYFLKYKTVQETVEYEEGGKTPARKKKIEEEQLRTGIGPVDVQKLRQLTAAMKDLRDIFTAGEQEREREDAGGVLLLAARKGAEDEASPVDTPGETI